MRRGTRARQVSVIAVDGRSGAGKSLLATAVGLRLAAPVIRFDDVYPGWDGLAASIELVDRLVLTPLIEGRPARWRRWDWTRNKAVDGPDGVFEVEPAPIVLLEGCGASAERLADRVSALIWLEVDRETRLTRLRGRDDWPTYAGQFERWADQEERLYSVERPWERADLVIG